MSAPDDPGMRKLLAMSARDAKDSEFVQRQLATLRDESKDSAMKAGDPATAWGHILEAKAVERLICRLRSLSSADL
jgi:hypothetical protein